MNTLSYKGFIGTVNFSEKDSVFFGKIARKKDSLFIKVTFTSKRNEYE